MGAGVALRVSGVAADETAGGVEEATGAGLPGDEVEVVVAMAAASSLDLFLATAAASSVLKFSRSCNAVS